MLNLYVQYDNTTLVLPWITSMNRNCTLMSADMSKQVGMRC